MTTILQLVNGQSKLKKEKYLKMDSLKGKETTKNIKELTPVFKAINRLKNSYMLNEIKGSLVNTPLRQTSFL